MVLISGLDRNPSSTQCSVCGSCQTLGHLISGFDRKTPEMQNVCIAMSSPLAITVCVFLMISKKDRRRLLSSRYFEEDDVEKGATIMNATLGIELSKGM